MRATQPNSKHTASPRTSYVRQPLSAIFGMYMNLTGFLNYSHVRKRFREGFSAVEYESEDLTLGCREVTELLRSKGELPPFP